MRIRLTLMTALALTASAQVPDGAALLIRSGGSIMLADRAHVEGREISDVVATGVHQTVEDTFSLWRASGKYRMEGKVGNSTLLLVSDGATLWTYLSNVNAYSQAPLTTLPPDPLSKLKPSRDPAGFHDAKVDRQEQLEFAGKSVPCYVVRASYDSMPGSPVARDVVRTVWIAQSNDLILRDTWEFTVYGGPAVQGKSHVTTDFTVIASDLPLADDLFIFHPPEGSRVFIPGQPATAPPPVPAAPNGAKTLTATVSRKVEAQYSAAARAAGLQGTVSLYVEVGPDGKAASIGVMQGLGLGLDEKAIEAVKHWEFKLDHPEGTGVQDAVEAQVQFVLDPPAPWRVNSQVYWFMAELGQHASQTVKPVLKKFAGPTIAVCLNSGTATVELTVDGQGMPHGLHVVRADNPALGEAVSNAVKNWEFEPGLRAGKPAEARAEIQLACRPGETKADTSAASGFAYRVGGEVSAPKLQSKAEPEYSDEARIAKLQGTAQLYVEISAEGVATNIHVIQRLGLGLDQKAMEAVKRWRFTPAMKDGKPVPTQGNIDVNFRLR